MGSGQNWVALIAWVAVVLLVARVVSRLQELRLGSARHAADSQRLFELSELLVADKPVPELLGLVASSVRSAFELTAVVVLMPSGDGDELEIAAADALEGESLDSLIPAPGTPASLTGGTVAGALSRQIPLAAARATGRPPGAARTSSRLAQQRPAPYLRQPRRPRHRAGPAARAGFALDLLQEVDEWRAALVGSVAHDLRTPLASIKVAVSDLRDPTIVLAQAARQDLLETIEEQTDRLTRLVSTVLDLWRLEAGAWRPKHETVVIEDLIDEAAALVESSLEISRLRRVVTAGLPPLQIDPVLIAQALANLLENAARHSPTGAEIIVEAGEGTGSSTR